MTLNLTFCRQPGFVKDCCGNTVANPCDPETVSSGIMNFTGQRNTMKQKQQKQYWASFAGYVLTIMVALQPLFQEEPDLSNRMSLLRFFLRMIAAVLIAVCTKYLKDRLSQQSGERTDA